MWGAPSRRRLVAVVLLVAVVALVPSISFAPASAAPSSTPSGSVPADSGMGVPAGHASSMAPSPVGPANSSGRGTFYSTRALPSPSFANETCVGALCYNVSNDVTTNLTSRGTLAVAYTSLTDQSPCAALRPYSVSNIALVTSANRGRTWSSVRYLGNPNCGANGFPDAWEPTLTSLANGTLVLAYVEYNLTAGALPPLTAFSWPPSQSRLVLSESYDDGVAWTNPQVLNISNPISAPPGVQYTPALPSVTAFGDSIYLTWMSLSFEDSLGAIALLVSTDGGQVWSPTVPVSTGPFADYSMDPQALVTPNGNLYIAYTSNVSFQSFFCGDDGCHFYGDGVWAGSVWVASSATNGTYFNYSMAANTVPLYSPGWDSGVNPTSFGPFQTPAPQLAYSSVTGQLYLAFTAGRGANGTEDCFNVATSCLVGGLYFYASTDNGVTWTPGNIRNVVFDPDFVDPSSRALNGTDSVTSVAIAVTGSGAVDLEASFYNGSTCFGTVCGAATEAVFSTPDNGTTFTSPIVVDATYTPYAYAWSGEYGAVDVFGPSPLYFWGSDTCPAWRTTPCGGYPGSDLAVAQVELSSLFTGTGTSLFFNASGFPSNVNWSVSVMGNDRSGYGNETLSVSGVPEGVPILWSVENINLSYAHYESNGPTSPASPQALSAPLGVVATFSEFVPVTISYTVPSITGIACGAEDGIAACPTFYPLCYPQFAFNNGCFSLYFLPVPPTGQQWVPASQPVTIDLASTPIACNTGGNAFADCYIWIYNLTLLGWSGAGPGSASTSAMNITFSPDGPVTETASFVLTGVCNYFYATFFVPPLQNDGCVNFNGPLTVAEHGLPAGTQWGVTFTGAAGSSSVLATAPDQIVNPTAGVGFGGIEAWNIPGANPADVWQAVSNVPAVLLLPYTNTILVNYTLVPVTDLAVPLTVETQGLPAGLAGNLTVTDENTGTQTALSVGAGGVQEVEPGGQYLINASSILTTTGVGYNVAEIYVTSTLLNYSNQSALSPATVLMGGSTTVIVAYGTENWVQVSAGLGGSASPTSRWVPLGGTITLHASANTGDHFLAWVGTGSGATAGSQDRLSQVVIQPGGPVTELATFAPDSASTWTVQVTPAGLPDGVEYSVTLGGSTYSGIGTLSIGNLSSNTYTLGFPTVPGVGTTVSRYNLSSVTASAGLAGNQLTVDQNLTVSPVYTTQFLVSVTVVGDGSVSLAPGTYWRAANSLLTITSTPASGYAFQDWSGSFDGAAWQVLTNQTTLSATLTGSLEVVARFVPATAIPAATYSLTLTESGLPSGTPWQFVLASGAGIEGAASALSLSGLNGSYQVTIPILYTAPGVRYVPLNITNTTLSVGQNVSDPVTFQEQVLVTAAASGAGSATGGGWYPYGTSVTLTAASSGGQFAGWDGAGAGSYSGMSLNATLVASAPVSETATFVAATSSVSSAPTTPLYVYIAVGLVVAILLAIGIAEGYLMGRRRRPPPASVPARRGPAPRAGAPPTAAAPATPAAPPADPNWSEN
jgi:hypothetical protein